MTAIEERSEVAQELYAHVQERYRKALETMLALVPAAKAHFEVGNVHSAFRLLNEAQRIRIPSRWGITKEHLLELIMQALPSTYQIGDMDPTFEPPSSE